MSEPAAPPVCYRHSDRPTYISCQRCGKPICPDCMMSAAVGFHCPDCVREGARATRSGRTAYGGRRSGNAALTSQILVGLNLAVFAFILATGWSDSDWVIRLGLVPDIACARANEVGCVELQDGVARGSAWQLLTVMFTHVQLWHIAFNMLALWVLGPQLELALGRLRFLGLYLLSGLTASATIYWLSDPYGLTVGASGALFGLMGALLVIAYKVSGEVRSLMGWLAFNFVITFTIPNISWQGHVGGFVGGVVIAALLAYAPKRRRAAFQWAGLGLVAVLIATAVAVRTADLRANTPFPTAGEKIVENYTRVIR